MKTFFILTLIIISSILGSYFSRRLKFRCVFLKNISYMLEDISLMIEYDAAEVGDIIKRLCSNKRYEELDFLKALQSKKESDFSYLWEKSVSEKNYDFLTDEEIELIKDIGRKLGKTDICGQLNTIKYEKSQLEKMLKNAEDDFMAKGKLYRSLGVLCGAFIAILFI